MSISIITPITFVLLTSYYRITKTDISYVNMVCKIGRSVNSNITNSLNSEHISDYNIKVDKIGHKLTILFPIKGAQKKFTGNTKNTAPSTPGAYIVAKQSDWYYEWPTPKPDFSYTLYKGQAIVSKNQEPGYYACRPTINLLKGCGRPHEGIDIYAHYGTPIVAPENGNIISYGGTGVFTPAGKEYKNGGAGRFIKLVGNSGYTYNFMHIMGLSEAIAKATGVHKNFNNTEEKSIRVPVNAGDIIGYVGRTGGIINPHLHFEVMKDRINIDPNNLVIR